MARQAVERRLPSEEQGRTADDINTILKKHTHMGRPDLGVYKGTFPEQDRSAALAWAHKGLSVTKRHVSMHFVTIPLTPKWSISIQNYPAMRYVMRCIELHTML